MCKILIACSVFVFLVCLIASLFLYFIFGITILVTSIDSAHQCYDIWLCVYINFSAIIIIVLAEAMASNLKPKCFDEDTERPLVIYEENPFPRVSAAFKICEKIILYVARFFMFGSIIWSFAAHYNLSRDKNCSNIYRNEYHPLYVFYYITFCADIIIIVTYFLYYCFYK